MKQTELLNRIYSWELIKRNIESNITNTTYVEVGNAVALNSCNSALVDLYRKLLNKGAS
jgi:hypothetical protein